MENLNPKKSLEEILAESEDQANSNRQNSLLALIAWVLSLALLAVGVASLVLK